MAVKRRTFLQSAAGLALATPLVAGGCSAFERDKVTGHTLESKLKIPPRFRAALPIPTVLAPTHRDATTDYYEIVQREARQEIVPGTTTLVWGYAGTFPGPTIESRRGRRTVVRHINRLPVPTVVHLHGGRTPPSSDGYPIDYVMPESGWTEGDAHMGHGDVAHGQRDYVYPLEQRAATLWYHDHRMDYTGPSVWRGLAGIHLIHDEEEDALRLPSGDRDIPLMICDRSFDSDGSFLYPARDPSLRKEPGVTDDYTDGVLGDVILVNGAPWPVLEISASLYRFRILNASNARRYELALSGGDTKLVQIGSDGGLLGSPVEHDSIPIAQAERFDVLVDFSGHSIGSEVTLENRLGDGPLGSVMRFKVTRPGTGERTIPERLADMSAFDALTEGDSTTSRTFKFAQDGKRDGMKMWTVNGKMFDPDRIDARPVAASTETWDLRSDPAHPVHLHQVPFKILSRDRDDGPRPTDAGWKDVIDLVEGESAKILVRFDGIPGRYVFHCHNLEHEDMAMMANFEIVGT